MLKAKEEDKTTVIFIYDFVQTNHEGILLDYIHRTCPDYLKQQEEDLKELKKKVAKKGDEKSLVWASELLEQTAFAKGEYEIDQYYVINPGA